MTVAITGFPSRSRPDDEDARLESNCARPDSRRLSIRHATLLDLSAMDRIEQEAFNTPWSRELLRGAIYNMRYDVRVVRAAEDYVAGFYIAHGVQRRSNLDNLAVDGGYRRRGYGRDMLDDWIRRSREIGLDRLTLQVNTANTAAQLLYEDYGFRVRRTLKRYYTNGQDAYEMTMALAADDPCPSHGKWSYPQFGAENGDDHTPL